jgi:hypothetical protein
VFTGRHTSHVYITILLQTAVTITIHKQGLKIANVTIPTLLASRTGNMHTNAASSYSDGRSPYLLLVAPQFDKHYGFSTILVTQGSTAFEVAAPERLYIKRKKWEVKGKQKEQRMKKRIKGRKKARIPDT